MNPFIPAGQPGSRFQQEFGSRLSRSLGAGQGGAEDFSMLRSQFSLLSAEDFSMLSSQVLPWETPCWDMGRAGGERFVMPKAKQSGSEHFPPSPCADKILETSRKPPAGPASSSFPLIPS